MRRYTKLAFTLIVAFVPFGIFGSAAHGACNPSHIGMSADCPDYTAPATTAVRGLSVDGTRRSAGNNDDAIPRNSPA
jgi:hypothetical protein